MKKMLTAGCLILVFCFAVCCENIQHQTSISKLETEVVLSDGRVASKYISHLYNFIENEIVANQSQPLFTPIDVSCQSEFVFETNHSYQTKCYLLKLNCSATNWIIMFLDENADPQFIYLGETFSEIPQVYFANVVGDGNDELITHLQTMSSGKMGPYYESEIYQLSESSIDLMYTTKSNISQYALIDTGYEVEFFNSGKGMASNKYVEMKVEFDTSLLDTWNRSDCHNLIYENKYENIIKNNFAQFEPFDYNDDGIYEIITQESFFIDFQGPLKIGECHTVLVFDDIGAKYSAIKASFVPQIFENEV